MVRWVFVMWMCGIQWQKSERGSDAPRGTESPTNGRSWLSHPGGVAWTLPWSRVRDSGNQRSVTRAGSEMALPSEALGARLNPETVITVRSPVCSRA